MPLAIETNDIYHTYPNGVQALNGVSIEIQEGEVFSLLGPNGAGKSTFINILIGLLKPTKGSVRIKGVNLFKRFDDLKTKIGYVPQNLVFYETLTVEENARLFTDLYRVRDAKNRINELFDLFEMHELRKQKARELSGGQKRRLNVLLGMLHSPEILFLDEPSAGMDPQNRYMLWKSIEEQADTNGTTIILTTHLMEVADRLSQRLAIIDHGKVMLIGSPKEIKQHYGSHEIIEIKFHEGTREEQINELFNLIQQMFPEITKINSSLLIPTKDPVSSLAKINGIILQTQMKQMISAITFRGNTLEDVFIQLTGSKLRE